VLLLRFKALDVRVRIFKICTTLSHHYSRVNCMRFSEYFKLGKTQAELDFIDIPLTTDIRLFLDPYALGYEQDSWFQDSSSLVINYFETLVDSIRNANSRLSAHLVSHLQEPNDTHMGFSSGVTGPAGRGIGLDQARALLKALSRSRAVQTGNLQDLSECELYIPGIGPDKISDMTINIIRGKLVEYTERQCQLHGIPTFRIGSGMYWDNDNSNWANRYADLPVYKGKRVILVPKAAARFRVSSDHQEYYNSFVLNYLQAEHAHPGDSLAHLLKNGRIRVYKKNLKEHYPLSKEFLYEFSQENPEVLEHYKKYLREVDPGPPYDEAIEATQSDPKSIEWEKLIADLDTIPFGNEAADQYHRFILGALESVFYPSLYNPVKEQEIDDGRKRIDITFTNRADEGFFHRLAFVHNVHCPYIFFECKNYSKDIKNPEVDQLAGRFNPRRGKFGVLVCRSVRDQKDLLLRCRDILHNDRGVILVLDDQDIKRLLELRSIRNFQGISNYMEEKMKQLVM
jgi:hypothetical protein